MENFVLFCTITITCINVLIIKLIIGHAQPHLGNEIVITTRQDSTDYICLRTNFKPKELCNYYMASILHKAKTIMKAFDLCIENCVSTEGQNRNRCKTEVDTDILII